MNMHGFITPASTQDRKRAGVHRKALTWARAHRGFLLVVVLPLLLLGSYYYLVAADQYGSEARFTVQNAQGPTGTTSGMGSLLGITGGLTPSQSQAVGVIEYLESQEAVDELQRRIDLVAMFRRAGVDPLSRLRADPTPEALLSYYKRRVKIRYNRDTGISELDVTAFTSADSYRLASALLELGEARVNYVNERIYSDAVSNARIQLTEAEVAARDIERQMTSFRQTNKDVNPTASGQAQTTLVAQLEGSLAASRAQLAQMRSVIGANSPQYRALAARVATMEAEIGHQTGRLAGGNSGTIAARLGNYEDLTVRQEFAAKRYEAAAGGLQKALEQARSQSLYLVRVVDPIRAVRSEFPQRGKIMALGALLVLTIYAIGWLIVAGVKEHAV